MAYADQNTERRTDPDRYPKRTRQGTSPKPLDPSRPAVARPAHPLPEHRTGTIDYDRYLERSTNKFKIFSAEERRRRKRTVATVAAVVAAVVIIVIWAILSQAQ